MLLFENLVPVSRTDAILKRLLALHPKLIDLRLDRIERLLAQIGHPEERMPPIIHVAGTNGKGSTIAYLRAFLEAFGRADRVATCACERTADASVPQALHLNNGATLNEKLRDKQSVVSKWIEAKLTDAEIVDRVYLAALTRPPTDVERKRFVALLAEAAKDGPQARREAVEDFVWAVLTGREFFFNH